MCSGTDGALTTDMKNWGGGYFFTSCSKHLEKLKVFNANPLYVTSQIGCK